MAKSADHWWPSSLDSAAGALRGVKREPEDEVHVADVKPTDRKRQYIERRKSVRFADEADAALELVYPIPVKEETWPYGSLTGESYPKAFPEFDHLYGDCVATTLAAAAAKASPASSLDLSGFQGADAEAAADDELSCFNDIKSCVGMAFLMMDGSIARGVCATSSGLWGKKFVRHEALVEAGLLPADAYPGLRPADYLETDMYVQINKGEVASVCRVICADVDLPAPREGEDSGVLPSLTKSSPTHKGKPIKTFFYSWYFCHSARTAHPYLAGESRAVSVFWPEDRKWYSGVLDGTEGGLHRVVYDVDGSEEYVNLLQLREQGCLSFTTASA